jgi:hypothetical protein
MKAYIVDNNGYHIGERQCQPSPLEPGKFLIPGGCIEIPPIETGENEIAKWDGKKWVKAPDFSGNVYYSKTDRSEKRFQLGEEFDENYTEIKPLHEQFQKFENGKWIVDNDAKELHEKKVRIAELKQLLAESDFRMTTDYFASMNETDKSYWTDLRHDWREELRGLDIE